jgi:ParB family chromosome partitioning protein
MIPTDSPGPTRTDTVPDVENPGVESALAVGGGQPGGLGELAWADPRELVVGVNTRVDVRLDPHFVASIRDRGVREPITVRRRAEDGALVVRKGQRRTLAAVRAGLDRVKVLVEVEAEPDASAAAQIERIVDQLGENQHRANIVDVDEVRAHQQLLDLGLSAAQIARQTRTPAKRVRATTTVARSELAAAVLDRYDITLDQAAVIAGFDDGTPAGREAIKTLTVTAQREPERFAHVVQRVRNDREDTALIAARAAELTDAGIAVLADPDDHDIARRTTDLRPRAGDPSGTPLRSADHASCPGHAVHLTVLRRSWMREEGPQVQEESYCLDPNTHGHADRYAGAAAQGPGSQGSGSSYAGLSEEQKETRRAEKRRVVENNKAWDSAVTVRREWLRTVLLARKTAPKDAGRYIATVLAQGGHDVRKALEGGNKLACELLGLDVPAGYYAGRANPIAKLTETASAAKATMLTLAVLLAAAEDNLGRHSWRNGLPESAAYMRALKSWGYPLEPVEELVIDPHADRESAQDANAAETGEVSDLDEDADETGEAAGDENIRAENPQVGATTDEVGDAEAA